MIKTGTNDSSVKQGRETMQTLATIRTFKTANFTVTVQAAEDLDVDLSFDGSGEVIEQLESGELVVFCAVATVHGPNGEELAADYLGSCIYEDYAGFMDHKECGKQNKIWEAEGSRGRCGSYFSDMIKSVCEQARIAMLKTQSVYVRS